MAIAVSLLGVGALSMLGAVSVAHAAGTPLSTWCSGAGLSYDATTSTCTVTTYNVQMSVNVEIASGGTLVVSGSSCPAGDCPVLIINRATLLVDSGGTIIIENTGGVGIGVGYSSTLDNSGTITIENSGSDSTGIDNLFGTSTLTNECAGTIDIANTSGTYAGFDNHGTINKYGMITGTVTEESGGVLNDHSASCSSSGTTTISSTISPSTSSTAPTTFATTSAATSSPSNSSGGGVPEFPFQGVLVAAVTLAVIASYFVMRRSNRNRIQSQWVQ